MMARKRNEINMELDKIRDRNRNKSQERPLQSAEEGMEPGKWRWRDRRN